jgi:hypothetical protein
MEEIVRQRKDNIINLPVSKKVSPVTTMTGKHFALHIKNIRNQEIEMYNAMLKKNESEMKRLREKHDISRKSFFKLPSKILLQYHKLQKENYLFRVAIFDLVSNKF